MISIRKLAAVDIAFLGPRVVLAEFGLGVLGPTALGVLSLVRAQSVNGSLIGAYLISLGINYIPLMWYAVRIARGSTAVAEIADESSDRGRLFRRYRRQSLILLLPLVVPIAALWQEYQRRKWNA